MLEIVPVLKDENQERPVPSVWRDTLCKMVEGFKDGDFTLSSDIENVHPISSKEASRIKGNVEEYGDALSSLPEETWNTSVYRWMRGSWKVLVDLYTVDEGASDLVMFVQVQELNGGYAFEVESINVP